MRWLRYLLVFVPIAGLAEFVLHNEILIFATSAIALIPLAGVLGEVTEELAGRRDAARRLRDRRDRILLFVTPCACAAYNEHASLLARLLRCW